MTVARMELSTTEPCAGYDIETPTGDPDPSACVGSDSERERPSHLLLLLGMTLLGLALRFHGIGKMDFWYDEVILWDYSLSGSALYTPTEPPLMSWLLYLVMWWLRSGDALFIHLLPALLGTLTIPVAYCLAREVGRSPLAGLIAAALTAFSPMAIYYSREGRPYALFILVSAGLYWSFIRADDSRGRRSWWVFSVLLSLCFLSHLLTIQIVAALTLFVLAALGVRTLTGLDFRSRLERFGRFLLFGIAGAASGSVWFVLRYFSDPAVQFNLDRTVQSGVYPNGPLAFLRDVSVNLGAGPVGTRLGIASPGAPEALGAVFVSLFLAGIWQLLRKGEESRALLLVLAVVVPLAINYLTLGGKGSWDWMRWISHALVPFLVAASIGLQRIAARAGSRYAQTAVVLLAVGCVMPQSIAVEERPDYAVHRDISRYLSENSGSLAGVLILPARPEIPSPADQRILDIYYYHKRETLPVHLMGFGTLVSPVFKPSRGNIRLLPREGNGAGSPLKSGSYAVLSRLPAVDCEKIPRWLKGSRGTARSTAKIKPGLTVCDLAFEP